MQCTTKAASPARRRLLVPIDETCFQLGVKRTTVFALIKDAKLERVHIGSRALVTQDSIDRFVLQRRAEGPTNTAQGRS